MAKVDLWFQDESRVGQQGSISRVWHYRGERPRLVRQQQFEYSYIYGAICPARRTCCGLVLPRANSEGMRLHLQEISAQVPEGHHAVVIVDGAGWHQTSLNLPNVSLLKLPPYSPELNPMEQVWQWLKQHYLSNRCFKDYTEIVDACCMAWNQFAKRTQLIQSIGTRKWTTC